MVVYARIELAKCGIANREEKRKGGGGGEGGGEGKFVLFAGARGRKTWAPRVKDTFARNCRERKRESKSLSILSSAILNSSRCARNPLARFTRRRAPSAKHIVPRASHVFLLSPVFLPPPPSRSLRGPRYPSRLAPSPSVLRPAFLTERVNYRMTGVSSSAGENGAAIRSNCKKNARASALALLFAARTKASARPVYIIFPRRERAREYVEPAALFSDSQSLVTCIMIA